MWRKKFKARLFVFLVKTLRTWAISIERNVPAEQTNDREHGDSIDPSDLMLQNSGGPPQHWIDLVREKAPELLSPHPKEVLSQPIEEVPSENLKTVTDQQEAPERQKLEEKEIRPKPPLLRFPKVPSILRGRTTKKTRAASTPSRSLTITPPSKPSESQELSRDLKDRQVTPREAPPSELSKLKNHDVKPHEPPKPKQRSSRQGEYIVRKAKRVEANDFSFVERTKETRPDSMPVSTEQHSHARRTTAPESPPIVRTHANREDQQQWPEISQTRRSPDGPTVQPPIVSDETVVAEETGTFVARPEVETRKRINFVLTPSHVHKTTEHRALPPATPKENQQGRRPVQHIVTPSSQQSNYRQQSEVHFDRADVHLPALLDEDTMSEAAAAQWTKTHPGENPWPDLPWTSAFEIEEEIAAHTREVERYRRLELEQRGTLWNE